MATGDREKNGLITCQMQMIPITIRNVRDGNALLAVVNHYHWKRKMSTIKTTLLVAALGAALGVQAAEVSLYGSVSTGLLYQNTPTLTDKATGERIDSVQSMTMESGLWGDSIWGISGKEDLGNGWSVGFTLENEFGSDTGEMAGADDGKLFDSQSYLRIGNDVVNIAFGSVGGLASAGGDFDLLVGFDPMQAYMGPAGLGAFASKDFASANMAVLEVTPAEGFKISLMGNMGDDDSAQKWADRDHYYGVGLSYEQGPLALAAVAETRRYDSTQERTGSDDAWTYTLAAAYDFEFVRPSLVYQHASKTREFGGEFIDSADAYQFDSFMLGATAPLGQGTLHASVQYVKGENEANSKEKADATILGVAYTYELSKRTSLYTGAYYSIGGEGLDKDLSASDTRFMALDWAAYNSFGAGFGLVHQF